ncbi:cytochrome P450 [Sinosporangium album]|uniref:cytochrome P450 n=1 Tax=Sinosporangium album TaxID=504805 RepID=UPI001C40A5DE|nr:cytochrome P450 [Sinosporangium album]
MDTARLAAVVLTPPIAQGVLRRRPRVVAAMRTLDADRRAVLLLRDLRDKYGTGPLVAGTQLRPLAVPLSAHDVVRVLDGAPEPFSLAPAEKRGALAHFQPHGLLLSRGGTRETRRQFTESVLDTDHDEHRLTADFTRTIDEEAAFLTERDHMNWPIFADTWWRIVRRITLGDAARDDRSLIGILNRLRSHANWSYFHPRHDSLLTRFQSRVTHYLDRAEPGSLAAEASQCATVNDIRPVDQIAHWLFAFEAAGITAYRALAVLAGDAAAADDRHIRASVLETVRLWPTTPLILRESTTVTTWDKNTTVPAKTLFLIHSAFINRDPATLGTAADRFTPDLWQDPPFLVPFSAGPGRCPGEPLVLLTVSTLLAVLLSRSRFQPSPQPDIATPLPFTFDHFELTFAIGDKS